MVYCHACGVDQATLRAALPDLTVAQRAATPRAPLTLAPGAMPNLYGAGVDPLPGAVLEEAIRPGAVRWDHVASFRYADADDWLCGVVDRWHAVAADGTRVDKTFRQRRPAFPTTGWLYGMGGHVLPLYGLPALYHRPEGAPVLVCEGEKDVHSLRDALPGYAVTTAPGGARGWHDVHHTSQLLDVTRDGAVILLVPDQDRAGCGWAAARLAALRPFRDVRQWSPRAE